MELDLHGLFELNNSFDYDDYEYMEESRRSCGFLAVFVPFLCSMGLLWGLLGNGLVLAVLWCKRQNLSVMDIFILHLGAADVLLVLTLPFWTVDAVKGWIFGTGFCKLVGALFKINLYCGIFLLALISLESYLSIVRGVQMFSRKKPLVIHLSCVIICFVSLLLSTPDWMYLKDIADPANAYKRLCYHVYPNNDLRVNTRILHLVAGVILPVLVLLCCCSCILLHIWHRSNGPQKKKDIRMQVFAALVLAFFVSWTPYNITFIVDTVTVTQSRWCQEKLWTASNATAVVGLFSSVVKPVIYLCLSKEFRQRAVTLLKFRGCESESDDVSLWDCGEVRTSACVQQEEQSSLRPMNDIKQTTITQDQDIEKA